MGEKLVEKICKNLGFDAKNESYTGEYDIEINNKKIENHILEERIESVKKFEINSTPTLIINNKKFNKPLTYKNIKKAIEKLI